MAAKLADVPDVEITQTHGGLGELSVRVDSEVVYDAAMLWYPRPSKVVAEVLKKLEA